MGVFFGIGGFFFVVVKIFFEKKYVGFWVVFFKYGNIVVIFGICYFYFVMLINWLYLYWYGYIKIVVVGLVYEFFCVVFVNFCEKNDYYNNVIVGVFGGVVLGLRGNLIFFIVS